MWSFINKIARLQSITEWPFTRAWCKTWRDYSRVSYMHGMKYIFDHNLNVYTRALWGVIILAMFISANHMAVTTWMGFIEEPSRFTIESDHANTAKLLYPSVTVCPATVFNFTKAKDFFTDFKYPENITMDDVLQSLDQINGFTNWNFKYSTGKLSILEAVMKLSNHTADSFLYQNRWNLIELFDRCRFQSKTLDCSELFQASRTSVGFCATFNTHQNQIPSKKYKSNRHSMRQGLSFVLKNVELDLEHTVSNMQRFEVLVNEAHVYPDEYTFRRTLRRNEEMLLRAQPIEITCSREVWRRLTIKERNCALTSEIKMRFFPEYHKQNCIIECRSMIVLKVCGCVPFYLFKDDGTLVCDFHHIPCLSDNFDAMKTMLQDCNCVDNCETVDFSLSLTRRIIDYTVPTVDPFYDGVRPNFTIVHVYMQSQIYRRLRRDIVWNLVAMAGNMGNCYGVFTGISSLAVCQFIYYFTFILKRNYCSMVELDKRILFKKVKSLRSI